MDVLRSASAACSLQTFKMTLSAWPGLLWPVKKSVLRLDGMAEANRRGTANMNQGKNIKHQRHEQQVDGLLGNNRPAREDKEEVSEERQRERKRTHRKKEKKVVKTSSIPLCCCANCNSMPSKRSSAIVSA